MSEKHEDVERERVLKILSAANGPEEGLTVTASMLVAAIEYAIAAIEREEKLREALENALRYRRLREGRAFGQSAESYSAKQHDADHYGKLFESQAHAALPRTGGKS